MARVLIVDDSPTEVYKLATMLEKNGHQVYKADNGADGVALARKELPDAILVTLTCEDLRKENELSENNDSATCSVCSAPIIPNSLFCSKCGNKLNR